MNEPIDRIAHLFEKLKHYVTLQIEITSLSVGEKVARLLAKLLANSVLVFLSIFVFFFASIAAAFAISACINSNALGFLIIAIFYLLMLAIFASLKRKFIEKPLINKFIRMFFSKNTGEKHNE